MIFPVFATGLFILLLGIILYFYAHKIPPNPFIGFRVGYAYITKQLWIKLNRIAGLSFTIIGAVLILLSIIIVDEVILALTLISLVIGDLIFLVVYSSRITELELLKIPEYKEENYRVLSSIPPTRLHYILTFLPYIASVLITLTFMNNLPNLVAVRFSLSGEPVYYLPKGASNYLTVRYSFSVTTFCLLHVLFRV